ncbi:MAG: protein translocase subunit SecF [Patescibacteria group bacterium]
MFYKIIQKRKIFLTISAVVILFSLIALIVWGLKFGIDFTGGTIMEVRYLSVKIDNNQQIIDKLKDLKLENLSVQLTGENGAVMRFKDVDEETHQKILTVLNEIGDLEEISFHSMGPMIGRELTNKARWSVILATLCILLYVAWSFRKLSKVIKQGESWRYAFGAIFSLFHDIIIIVGFYAVMGHFRQMEFNSLAIAAILTVLGYSVNDTIVVYDRIRENILAQGGRDLEEVVNKSLNETIARTFNTTLTTIFAILAVALFGGVSTRDFAFAMAVGVLTGAYSSISIAASFLLFNRKGLNRK